MTLRNCLMKVFIIGSGNVATHFALRLKSAGVDIAGIYSRTLENAKALADKVGVPYATDKSQISDADLYICSVKDDSISDALSGITFPDDAIVVHTAGSVDMNILKPFAQNIGVIYPMQTFSKTKSVDWNDIPVFIEANTQENLCKLQAFANILSPKCSIATSAQRKIIHLASVFACNFTNEIYAIAERLLTENGLDLSILHPLIDETVAKIKTMRPVDAQTGPAKRNDKKVMEMQMSLLNGTDKEIYKLISEAIIKELTINN